jgi:hypothetical protein
MICNDAIRHNQMTARYLYCMGGESMKNVVGGKIYGRPFSLSIKKFICFLLQE